MKKPTYLLFTFLLCNSVLFSQTMGPTTPTANVPTMSEWGLIILGLCLLVFGVVTVLSEKRKKNQIDC